MQKDELRLECLKLCFRRDRHPNENVVEAKIYEEYLSQDLEVTSEKGNVTLSEDPLDVSKEVKHSKATKSKKISGNPDAFL